MVSFNDRIPGERQESLAGRLRNRGYARCRKGTAYSNVCSIKSARLRLAYGMDFSVQVSTSWASAARNVTATTATSMLDLMRCRRLPTRASLPTQAGRGGARGTRAAIPTAESNYIE